MDTDSKTSESDPENEDSLLQKEGSIENIQIYLRIRPEKDNKNIENHNSNSMSIFDKKNNNWRRYNFNHCFSSGETQESVFTYFESISESVISGEYVSIIAYGQTGSGKTHTMFGDEENYGLLFRLLEDIFNKLPGEESSVFMSILEVYNERYYDLLGNSNRQINIIDNEDISKEINSYEDGKRAYIKGISKRATITTMIHEKSSRSHCLIFINVYSSTENGYIEGSLVLVDLAGSEKIEHINSSGIRLKEAQSINKSLSALCGVLQAMDKNSSHIPYRNSKLTYLLRDHINIDSKVMVIGTIRGSTENVSESINTLNYLNGIKKIKLINRKVSIIKNQSYEELEDEIKRLGVENDSKEIKNKLLLDELSRLKGVMSQLEIEKNKYRKENMKLKEKIEILERRKNQRYNMDETKSNDMKYSTPIPMRNYPYLFNSPSENKIMQRLFSNIKKT